MYLIYAYIKKYGNFRDEKIIFDNAFDVVFLDNSLSIYYKGKSKEEKILRGSGIDKLHVIVGKTGSGKTNLLQLIGAKKLVREGRTFNNLHDEYFLLYAGKDNQFFLEASNIIIEQFINSEDVTRPELLYAVRFRMKNIDAIEGGKSIFTDIETKIDVKGQPHCFKHNVAIVNAFDNAAFIKPPYGVRKENFNDFSNNWIGRYIAPYQKTDLYHTCDYLYSYITNIETGSAKKNVTLKFSSFNFTNRIPMELPNRVGEEYWTFRQFWKADKYVDGSFKERYEFLNDADLAKFSKKDQFIHDLWTDYAVYLRKFIELVHSEGEMDEPPYCDLENPYPYKDAIRLELEAKHLPKEVSFGRLPDGESLAISERCLKLAQYIDNIIGNSYYSYLQKLVLRVEEITDAFKKLDDKYFDVDSCIIPIIDLKNPDVIKCISTISDVLQNYDIDGHSLFHEELLPHRFLKLSTGEYHYAKVLGNVEYALNVSPYNAEDYQVDKIILLDEPETYMHPELARQFIHYLTEIVQQHKGKSTIQIIIATHSPFMLSDVLPTEVTRLDIDGDTGNTIVHNESSKKYFGANIHTILADSFFLKYTIGECSRKLLQEYSDELDHIVSGLVVDEGNKALLIEKLKIIVPQIGDKLIRWGFVARLQQLGVDIKPDNE